MYVRKEAVLSSQIEGTQSSLQDLLAAEAQLFEQTLPRDVDEVINFNDPNKLGEGQAMVDRLTNLIGIFQKPELDFSQNRAEHDDIVGDAYEYNLNRRMEELLHGDNRWLAGPASAVPPTISVGGGITSEEEETEIQALNDWVESQALPRGVVSYDFADPQSGEQRAVFDLAWPSGLQEELSQPVAVLLNENGGTIKIAGEAGFRCFTHAASFRRYVEREVLGETAQA